jgi:PPOX class probable F420-dependent enzyme
MSNPLPASIVAAIEAGPIAHVATVDADGCPHVSMAWIGLDAGEIVIGTLHDQRKLRNVRRDGRVAVSFTTGRRTAYGLDESVVLYGTGRVEPGGAAALLQRLARTYLGPDVVFPGMPNPPAGFTTRIAIERFEGLGAWTETAEAAR